MSRPLTVGEKRVVHKFNVSGDPEVGYIKEKMAALIDDINAIPNTNSQTGRWKSIAMSHVEDAAMYAVKALTAGQDESLDV